MREYVARMTACGIPMRTAVKIYADFKKRHKLKALDKYIAYVEAIQHGGVETVSE